MQMLASLRLDNQVVPSGSQSARGHLRKRPFSLPPAPPLTAPALTSRPSVKRHFGPPERGTLAPLHGSRGGAGKAYNAIHKPQTTSPEIMHRLSVNMGSSMLAPVSVGSALPQAATSWPDHSFPRLFCATAGCSTSTTIDVGMLSNTGFVESAGARAAQPKPFKKAVTERHLMAPCGSPPSQTRNRNVSDAFRRASSTRRLSTQPVAVKDLMGSFQGGSFAATGAVETAEKISSLDQTLMKAEKRSSLSKALMAAAKTEDTELASQQGQQANIQEAFKNAKAEALACWNSGRFDQCLVWLNECITYNKKCDTLFRFRSKLHFRLGSFEDALSDADRAIELDPSRASNYTLQGRCLHQLHRLGEAGSAYISGLGGSATSDQSLSSGYPKLLDSVRRQRGFFPGCETRREMWEKARSFSSPSTPCVFDPRKIFDEGGFSASVPTAPRLFLKLASPTSLSFTWDEPYNGGDPIFKYEIEMAIHDVKWEEDKNQLFDGYRDAVKVFEGKAAARSAQLDGLRPDNDSRLRIRCHNSVGPSTWSDTLQVSTLPEGMREQRNGKDPLPTSWLRIDCHDVLCYEEKTFPDRTASSFYRDLAAALQPQVNAIRLIFQHFSSLGVAAAGGSGGMSPLQFSKFVKNCKLSEGAGHNRICKPLSPAAAASIFQRANMKMFRPGRRGSTNVSREGEDPVALREAVIDELGKQVVHDDVFSKEDPDISLGKSNGVCEIDEFVNAIIRLAWACFPAGHSTASTPAPLGDCLDALFSIAVIPACDDVISPDDPLKHVLRSRRVRAIIHHYRPQLKKIFDVYAQADRSDTDLGTLNLKETTFMMKEGNMFNSQFPVSALVQIFSIVNKASQAEGEDDDETELDFCEFLEVLMRICDLKIPEAQRQGGEFELTLQSWLHLLFLPTYMKLLKDKARGVGKLTV